MSKTGRHSQQEREHECHTSPLRPPFAALFFVVGRKLPRRQQRRLFFTRGCDNIEDGGGTAHTAEVLFSLLSPQVHFMSLLALVLPSFFQGKVVAMHPDPLAMTDTVGKTQHFHDVGPMAAIEL